MRIGEIPPLTAEKVALFWAGVERSTPDVCWPWKKSTSPSGYGRFDRWRAHRVAYQLAHGALSPTLTIDHLCRNKRCVNPAHLEAVTLRENILRSDSLSARAARRTHCHCGQPLEMLSGVRGCRTCKYRNNRAYTARRSAAVQR